MKENISKTKKEEKYRSPSLLVDAGVKQLKEAIEAMLRIEGLWLPGKVTEEHEDEARALYFGRQKMLDAIRGEVISEIEIPAGFKSVQGFIDSLLSENQKWFKAYKEQVEINKTGSNIMLIALQKIADIAYDYDGYKTVKGLKKLIDELRRIALEAVWKFFHEKNKIIKK